MKKYAVIFYSHVCNQNIIIDLFVIWNYKKIECVRIDQCDKVRVVNHRRTAGMALELKHRGRGCFSCQNV